MKLFFTETSPYVRKVRVAAFELGLQDRIETQFLRPVPVAADATLSRVNPLSKIPALVLDDGTTLYDSPVICEYLDTLHAGEKLVPDRGPPRFRVLRLQALCDGILEAAILVFYERTARPQALHWAPWTDGQSQKARQGLDELEREAPSFGSNVDLAQICTAVTLSWLEFRQVLGDIRAGRPKLSAWYDAFRTRPSMHATEPKG
ncbi:MAG: glutathione S-transferase N-terminal domain-containing protein [Polyangiaceae bacterium]|jgi:glutathione S-transferase